MEFGNLTLLVGPQATGKSLFLQLFKLLVDISAVKAELRRFNLRWNSEITSFRVESKTRPNPLTAHASSRDVAPHP